MPSPRLRVVSLLAVAAQLAAHLSAQAPGPNRSLLQPEPASPTSTWSTQALARGGAAVVHVAVEVTNGRNTFAIERPSSGVIVDASGLVVTWWDLVREADGAKDKHVVVRLTPGGDALPATIAAHDEASQLALLQVTLPTGAAITAATLAPQPAPGAAVLVCAMPETDRVVTAGVATPALAAVPLHGHTIAPTDLLLTDARIDDRGHGGALLDAQGRLLGLCSSEHVHKQVAEPKLEDLKAKNFGCVLGAARIRSAFAADFARLHATNASLRGEASGPVATDPGTVAVAAAQGCVVGVRAAERAPNDPGAEDPFAARRVEGIGSGVVIAASGLVVTNQHLLGDATRATVQLANGKTVPAKLVHAHPPSNLALLQCELPAGTTLTAARCSDGAPSPGEIVFAVGRPFGGAITASIGVLSALRDGGRLQADANLGNQNAGGALVDATGALLGIVDGGRIDAVDLQFAMQGDRAKTETNLAFCCGIAAVRRAFADQLERSAPDFGGAAAIGAAAQQQRTGDVARAVHVAAPAMLNVYISAAQEPVADDTANPFADQKPVAMQTESLGSGVVIDASGLAITNWHVVDSATEPDGSMRKDHAVRVRSFDGRSWPVQVLAISREDDLALVQLQLAAGEVATPVQLGDSTALQPGEPVLAIGNPLGLANTITAGVVVAKEQGIHVKGRWAKLENLIETDAAINGGNSGGALLDLRGRLVGINSAGSSGFGNRGYAIPVDHVRKQLLSLLLSPEKLRSPCLGLQATDQDGGVAVASVTPDGPAARAGVQQGDRIVSLGGTAVVWTPGFALQLRALDAAAPVPLVVRRGTSTTTCTVQPWSAAQWAVVRQSGLELEEVTLQQAPAVVQGAATALHRAFTGDTKGAPTEFPEQVLRVRAVHARLRLADVDLQPGDLLLAAELPRDDAPGEAAALRRFAAIADVQVLFNDRERGSYEGAPFRCWRVRGDAAAVVPITARRLLP